MPYTSSGGARTGLPAGVDPKTAAANIQGNIDALTSRGAKYFLWVNLPPIGETPAALSGGFSAILDSLASEFNTAWTAAISQLQTKYPGIVIVAVDANALFTAILNKPSVYGFTNVTSPAQSVSGINPNNYLFWDDEHPTTAADALARERTAVFDTQAALGRPGDPRRSQCRERRPGRRIAGDADFSGGSKPGTRAISCRAARPEDESGRDDMAQTQVFFNGIAAPLFYVQSGQTIAVAPYRNLIAQHRQHCGGAVSGRAIAPFAMKG